VHGPSFDEPLVWYEGSGASDRRWLTTDQLGSVVAVTNGSGAATSVNTYDEYGVPGSSNAGRFQYTGQAWIGEAGVYHYKARAYSPALGRFLQADPILWAGGMNLYAYVANDPVNFIDPLGLERRCYGYVESRGTEERNGGYVMTAVYVEQCIDWPDTEEWNWLNDSFDRAPEDVGALDELQQTCTNIGARIAQANATIASLNREIRKLQGAQFAIYLVTFGWAVDAIADFATSEGSDHDDPNRRVHGLRVDQATGWGAAAGEWVVSQILSPDQMIEARQSLQQQVASLATGYTMAGCANGTGR
jgi:RHS repeat-associated protein